MDLKLSSVPVVISSWAEFPDLKGPSQKQGLFCASEAPLWLENRGEWKQDVDALKALVQNSTSTSKPVSFLNSDLESIMVF